MSVNEEMAAEPCSESFWEIGNFKRTVHRCDDGFELCNKLATLIQERAEIEKSYSTSLRRWSQKWQGFLEKGPEYGTMKSAWSGVAAEADEMAEIHAEMRQQLIERVQSELRQWQKENYHKTVLPPQKLKNTKEFDEKFHRAQKPWARQFKSVQEAKKSYHSACRQERSLRLQLQNAKNDPSSQAEQVRKLEDKVKRAEREMDRTELAYKNSVEDLDNLNPSYMRNMSEVFAECQEFERNRLVFFKEVLTHIHEVLDLTKDDRLQQTYSNMLNTIQRADAHQDLRWWAQHNGDDMTMRWPKFEQFVPEMKETINKAKKSGSSLATDDGVRLRAINSSQGGSVRSSTAPSRREENQSGSGKLGEPPRTQKRKQVTGSLKNLPPAYNDSLNPFAEDSAEFQGSRQNRYRSSPFEREAGEQPDAATAGEAVDADADVDDPLHDDGRPGVPVRAMYDYAGAEDDELNFNKGDEFVKLDDEDEQGWCKGRKDGRVGLYPANYAELIL